MDRSRGRPGQQRESRFDSRSKGSDSKREIKKEPANGADNKDRDRSRDTREGKDRGDRGDREKRPQHKVEIDAETGKKKFTGM